MPIENDLRSFLLGDGDIAALVSTRIYPEFIPQNRPVPAIVYQRILKETPYHLGGQGTLVAPRIQLSCWADDPDTRATLAELVRNRISGYQGNLGGLSPLGETEGIIIVNELHDHESETGRFRALLDVKVWHQELEPTFG